MLAQQVRRQIESELSVLELKVAMLEKEQEHLLDEMAQLKKENEQYSQELARDMHGIKVVLEEMIALSNSSSDPDVAIATP